MKVWITKYALTEGIIEVHGAKVCSLVSDDMIKVPSLGIQQYFHGLGKDWHTDRESALQRAETMRLAKIASMKKQLAKLEKMTFV